MIKVIATPYSTFTRLEIIRPDTKCAEFKNVRSPEEGNRLEYFLNRKYILEKLTGWLRQRRKALEASPKGRKRMEAGRLLILLECYQNTALIGLCKFIDDHRSLLESVAPGEHSGQYGHYRKTIIPILNFCFEKKGLPK